MALPTIAENQFDNFDEFLKDIDMMVLPHILLISHKKKLFDMPDKRKVHHAPIPRLGGLSFHGAHRGVCDERHQPDRWHRRFGFRALHHLAGGARRSAYLASHVFLRLALHLCHRSDYSFLVLQRVRQCHEGQEALHGRLGKPLAGLYPQLPNDSPEHGGYQP